MGNVLRGEMFCPTGRKDLGHPFKQDTVDFSLTEDINEIERSSHSFGVVPKSKVSTEELLCGSVEGPRIFPNIESERDNEQPDSFVSDESSKADVGSYFLNDYAVCPERLQGDTWEDCSNPNDENANVKSKITLTRYTSCGTSKSGRDGKTSDLTDSKLRKRGNAIEVTPIDRPCGKFLPGEQYYLQNGELQWEAVTIESWNFWNGTWQVRGENGVAFPATPSALKTEEEYRFFSRERSFSFRSFSSTEEIRVY